MIEAELKARLANPDAVRAALGGLATVEKAVYHDVYFDTAGGDLDAQGREVRLRSIETPTHKQHVLTYKEPPVDETSGSKPEYETTVATPAAILRLVEALGLRPFVELTKDCENYRFAEGGREFLATVVRVPEINGTFLEVETMAQEEQLDEALAAVRSVLSRLGVSDRELTSELYTDAVRASYSNS